FQRLRKGGTLYSTIDAAIRLGVRRWCLDRPRRGFVRAVQTDPKDYDREDWRRCLLAVLDGEPADRDDALRTAAEWAKENMGLQCSVSRPPAPVVAFWMARVVRDTRRGDRSPMGPMRSRAA
ncbi:hypothetical protein KKC91_12835, partial [bacterium]|nr:hypothetical protein [bacterium]